MNQVPLFATVKDDLTVQSLLGNSDFLRVFSFGNAPQNVELPYVVWQTISGVPNNYVTCRPVIEEHLIQIDCYAATQSEVQQVQSAIEYAIELEAKVTSYRGASLEPETKLWHIGFDVSWFVKR